MSRQSFGRNNDNVTIHKNLTIGGTGTIGGGLVVGGDTKIGGDLVVSGYGTIQTQQITPNDTNKPILVEGALDVQGDVIIEGNNGLLLQTIQMYPSTLSDNNSTPCIDITSNVNLVGSHNYYINGLKLDPSGGGGGGDSYWNNVDGTGNIYYEDGVIIGASTPITHGAALDVSGSAHIGGNVDVVGNLSYQTSNNQNSGVIMDISGIHVSGNTIDLNNASLNFYNTSEIHLDTTFAGIFYNGIQIPVAQLQYWKQTDNNTGGIYTDSSYVSINALDVSGSAHIGGNVNVDSNICCTNILTTNQLTVQNTSVFDGGMTISGDVDMRSQTLTVDTINVISNYKYKGTVVNIGSGGVDQGNYWGGITDSDNVIAIQYGDPVVIGSNVLDPCANLLCVHGTSMLSGNVGINIQPSSPSSKYALNVSGGINVTDHFYINGVDISGVNPWSATDSGNGIYYSSGGVAIGKTTLTTGKELDVSGNGVIEGNLDVSGILTVGTTPSPGIVVDVSGQNVRFNSGVTVGSSIGNTTSYTKSIYLDPSGSIYLPTYGNVYIGSTPIGDSLWNASGGSIYTEPTGGVAIGKNSVTSNTKLDVSGNTNINGDVNITGSITVNNTTKALWNTDPTNHGCIYYNNGGVAIGKNTVTSGYAMDIDGYIRFTDSTIITNERDATPILTFPQKMPEIGDVTYSGGLSLLWNDESDRNQFTSNFGYVDLLCNGGGGTGGFMFYIRNNSDLPLPLNVLELSREYLRTPVPILFGDGVSQNNGVVSGIFTPTYPSALNDGYPYINGQPQYIKIPFPPDVEFGTPPSVIVSLFIKTPTNHLIDGKPPSILVVETTNTYFVTCIFQSGSNSSTYNHGDIQIYWMAQVGTISSGNSSGPNYPT